MLISELNFLVFYIFFTAQSIEYLYYNPCETGKSSGHHLRTSQQWTIKMSLRNTLSCLLLVAFFIVPVTVDGNELVRDALFHVERNTNANIIQYDAQLEADGKLNSKKPVVGYWVRLAEQGQVKKMNWIQRRFVYGFKAKLNKKENTATLKMVADIGRIITVKRDGEDFRAVTEIDGVESYIERVFFHASGKGMSARLDYVEFYGTAMNSLDEKYERFTP